MILIAVFTVLYSSCKKEEVCNCADYEECIEGVCETKDNAFRWGSSGAIVGEDLYFGVVENHACIDTVVFNVKSDDRFSIYTIAEPSVKDAGVFVNLKHSDTEYILGVGDALCYDLDWYANIECKLFVPDSVQLKFHFWDFDTPPGVVLDTVSVTLYK